MTPRTAGTGTRQHPRHSHTVSGPSRRLLGVQTPAMEGPRLVWADVFSSRERHQSSPRRPAGFGGGTLPAQPSVVLRLLADVGRPLVFGWLGFADLLICSFPKSVTPLAWGSEFD